MPPPSVKLELSSSWLRGSPGHLRWWTPHPAGASGKKHRSGGSICAGRTELLLHTLLWCLHRSNLGAQRTIVLTTGIQSGMIVQFILTKHSLLGQDKTQIWIYPGPGGVLESSSICVGTEKAETKLSFDARWAHEVFQQWDALTNTLVSQLFKKHVRQLRVPLPGMDLQNIFASLQSSNNVLWVTLNKTLTAVENKHWISHSTIKLQTLTSLSGRLKRNSLSNRPGRLSAGSMESRRLVAPITTTSPRLSSPSMRANRVDTMEL